MSAPAVTMASPKSKMTALLLFLFLGGFSAHRFYVGRTGSAFLQMFTLGGLFIWAFIDFIKILTGRFTDSEGLPLTN